MSGGIKAPERIQVVEEIPQHQQMMQQIRRTPEGRAAIRELVRHMREASRPAIDVASSGTTEGVKRQEGVDDDVDENTNSRI